MYIYRIENRVFIEKKRKNTKQYIPAIQRKKGEGSDLR